MFSQTSGLVLNKRASFVTLRCLFTRGELMIRIGRTLSCNVLHFVRVIAARCPRGKRLAILMVKSNRFLNHLA